MQTTINKLYSSMISSLQVEGLKIPFTAVKFFSGEDTIADEIMNYHTDGISFTSCQATKQASLGDCLLLTKENIGCIAAAITFGLVDQYDPNAFKGPRTYTEVMRKNVKDNFTPPSPKDFTDGTVYACQFAQHQEYSLFGAKDSGRFKDIDTARLAISEMSAIQPARMKGVFFYSLDFSDLDLVPDVVVLSVRPGELARIVQAYQFKTGKRVNSSMGAVRAVNSDLIVRPYLTEEMNVSAYCIGASLIAKFDVNRLGIGIPFEIYKLIVEAMEESQTGYPFYLYPGAKDNF